MRDEFEWEKDVRAVYRHEMRRHNTTSLRLRVSYELAMEIQNDIHWGLHYIDLSKNDTTWQGIPVRLDAKLPPGCFIFDEGEIV